MVVIISWFQTKCEDKENIVDNLPMMLQRPRNFLPQACVDPHQPRLDIYIHLSPEPQQRPMQWAKIYLQLFQQTLLYDTLINNIAIGDQEHTKTIFTSFHCWILFCICGTKSYHSHVIILSENKVWAKKQNINVK